ncbi:hypothetical protein AA11826_0341 [Komagataeibacter oboediens DSM 11826]|nr:hypothetical protein [Komagataeibacter oboediens]GBR28714.1 hypothetical protein AA11826_0341 [Komagataeibacter oboediens DSM 11826]
MTTYYEVPLSGEAQTFTASMNGVSYTFTFRYLNCTQGGWVMDLADSSGNQIVGGIPLVTGTDLLGQYGYLGFGCRMFVSTDGDWDAVPTYDNLGTTSHLYVAID